MSEYLAPLEDMRFALRDLAALENIASLPAYYAEAGSDVVDAILDEAARFAGEILSPLNRVGDLHGSRLDGGRVVTAPGFREAYRRLSTAVGMDWPAIQPMGARIAEAGCGCGKRNVEGANHAFSLCPMLTQGAIEALVLAGTESQKALYLPALVAEVDGDHEPHRTGRRIRLGGHSMPGRTHGEWRLPLVRAKISLPTATTTSPRTLSIWFSLELQEHRRGSGHLAFFGFSRMRRGDLAPAMTCSVSLEHKLGIHGSPTAVLAFGDREGAQGSLVGEENRGLEIMFIMMNAARFNVGLEGLGDAERSHQRAAAYARERVQGTEAVAGMAPKSPFCVIPMCDACSCRCVRASRLCGLLLTWWRQHRTRRRRTPMRELALPGAFAELLVPVVRGEFSKRHRHRFTWNPDPWRDGLHRRDGGRPTSLGCGITAIYEGRPRFRRTIWWVASWSGMAVPHWLP